jgi:hypothetical protein
MEMTWKKKQLANLLLVMAALNIGRLIAVFFQTEYQLLTPLIPKDTVLIIARPYLVFALFCSLAFVAALIFYIYSRLVVSMIICALTIVVPPILDYFIAF